MGLSSDEVFATTASAPGYQGEGGGRHTGFHVYGSLTGSDIIWARDRFSNATYPVALGDGQSGITPTAGFHLYPVRRLSRTCPRSTLHSLSRIAGHGT